MNRRVALVVVTGVGDDAPDGAVRTVAHGLVTQVAGWRPDPAPEARAEPIRVPVRGDRSRPGELYEAPTLRVSGTLPDGEATVDVVAMSWSDLSSFPRRGLIPFFGALFGIGLQLTTVGLEATPPGSGRLSGGRWLAWCLGTFAAAATVVAVLGTALGAAWLPVVGLSTAAAVGAVLLGLLTWSRRGDTQGVANRLMETASWWAAAVLVPLTVMAALAGTALWLVVDDTAALPDGVAVAAVAILGAAAVRAVARGIAGGGWTYAEGVFIRILHPPLLAMLVYAAVLGIGAWRMVETRSVEGGLGQTTLLVGAYGLRPAWLAGLTLVALALVAVAIDRVRHPHRAGGQRAHFTRVATTLLGPLVVAIVGTILVGGIGAVAFKSASDATWGRSAGDVRCIASPSAWTWTTDCGRADAGWRERARGIPAILDAADRADADAAAARAAAVPPLAGGAVDASAAAAAAADSARADGLRDAASGYERDAGMAPTQWAQSLFEISMLPLVPIVLALIGSLLLGAAALALRSPDPGRGAPGSRLTDALGFFTSGVSAWCFWALGLGAVWLAWAIWTRPGLLGLTDSAFTGAGGVWAPVSALVVGALAVARIVPVDPRRWREDVGGALARLRVGADIAYDVATYLRLDHGGDGVRSRVVARYRALLDELERRGYREVVVAAHSQGSMYSVATIAGDRWRRDPEPGAGGWGVAPWREARPASSLRLALLTVGCPIRQTYETRLPGQYAWTGDARLAERLHAVGPAWINAFRARDYIGRSVFHDPLGAAVIAQGRYRSRRADRAGGGGPELVDVCIHGAGSHTGYFGDPELTRWIDHLLRRALGEPAAVPAGYSAGSEAP